ncbi:MAG: hypothetical protein WC707_05350 [Candidatus Babeliaceae bacterium]
MLITENCTAMDKKHITILGKSYPWKQADNKQMSVFDKYPALKPALHKADEATVDTIAKNIIAINNPSLKARYFSEMKDEFEKTKPSWSARLFPHAKHRNQGQEPARFICYGSALAIGIIPNIIASPILIYFFARNLEIKDIAKVFSPAAGTIALCTGCFITEEILYNAAENRTNRSIIKDVIDENTNNLNKPRRHSV